MPYNNNSLYKYINTIYQNKRKSALKRDLPFTVTLSELRDYADAGCSLTRVAFDMSNPLLYPRIILMNEELGYTRDNILLVIRALAVVGCDVNLLEEALDVIISSKLNKLPNP
jgi:hypothetical protein